MLTVGEGTLFKRGGWEKVEGCEQMWNALRASRRTVHDEVELLQRIVELRLGVPELEAALEGQDLLHLGRVLELHRGEEIARADDGTRLRRARMRSEWARGAWNRRALGDLHVVADDACFGRLELHDHLHGLALDEGNAGADLRTTQQPTQNKSIARKEGASQ
jgi:hypothetical protein